MSTSQKGPKESAHHIHCIEQVPPGSSLRERFNIIIVKGSFKWSKDGEAEEKCFADKCKEPPNAFIEFSPQTLITNDGRKIKIPENNDLKSEIDRILEAEGITPDKNMGDDIMKTRRSVAFCLKHFFSALQTK